MSETERDWLEGNDARTQAERQHETANDTSDLTWLDEAVKRGIDAWLSKCNLTRDVLTPGVLAMNRTFCRAAILAALPAINEAHAKAIERCRDLSIFDDDYPTTTEAVAAIEYAARIVRGFGSEVGR